MLFKFLRAGLVVRYLLFCEVIGSVATLSIHAQEATTNPPPLPSSAVATVTPEMGDVGGKYFGRTPDPVKTRHYYIAAEPELWNFAPLGQDPVCDKALPSRLLMNRSSWKIRYVQYADPNFTVRVLPQKRLGIMGPVLRGVTGQYLEVTFLNRGWRPLSMHPHGLKYDKDSEGSYYKPNPGLGAAIAPGAKFTYVWAIDENSTPRSDEPSSMAWLYHSHVAGDEETNLGLVGCIIVTDPKRARPDGTPKDVDREMAALFTIFDEARFGGEGVPDADDLPVGAKVGPRVRTWAETQQLIEEGHRYTINGLTFGNLTGLDMNEGERVRWYLFGLGSEEDFHSAHWHGERVLENGDRRTDVVELLPASMKVADMVANNPGQWLFHCHVAEHMTEGMFARMTISPKNSDGASKQPEVAFFGMPQSLVTLHLTSARLLQQHGKTPNSGIELKGEVTAPDPFPAAQTPFLVQLGGKSIKLQPDANGLCVNQSGVILITNTSLSGNGIVRGGTVKFELTLKGDDWIGEMRKAIKGQRSASNGVSTFPLSLLVGDAQHTAVVQLKEGRSSL